MTAISYRFFFKFFSSVPFTQLRIIKVWLSVNNESVAFCKVILSIQYSPYFMITTNVVDNDGFSQNNKTNVSNGLALVVAV